MGNGIQEWNKYLQKKILGLSNIISNSINLQQINSVSTNTVSTHCIHWYLVTTYDDGSIDYEYIGNTCSSGCAETKVFSKDSTSQIKILCDNSGSTSSSSNDATIDIKNKLLDSCLNKVANLLTNNNLKNAVTNILQNIFSKSTNINISFEESTTITDKNGNSLEAQTKEIIDPITGSKTEVIYLNPNEIPNSASQEYKASLIIHEVIHTYLNINDTTNLSQHTNMLENYIDAMSTSLKDFFPDMTIMEARSMSLQGLGSITNSPAFDTVLLKYGFNKIASSTDNFQYYYKQYALGTLGHSCNANSNTIPDGNSNVN